MEEDKKLTDFEIIQKYLKEEIDKANKAFGVSSMEEGLKKLEEIKKSKEVSK